MTSQEEHKIENYTSYLFILLSYVSKPKNLANVYLIFWWAFLEGNGVVNRKRAEELAYKVLVLSLIWGEISGFHFLICETRDTQCMVRSLPGQFIGQTHPSSFHDDQTIKWSRSSQPRLVRQRGSKWRKQKEHYILLSMTRASSLSYFGTRWGGLNHTLTTRFPFLGDQVRNNFCV